MLAIRASLYSVDGDSAESPRAWQSRYAEPCSDSERDNVTVAGPGPRTFANERTADGAVSPIRGDRWRFDPRPRAAEEIIKFGSSNEEVATSERAV